MALSLRRRSACPSRPFLLEQMSTQPTKLQRSKSLTIRSRQVRLALQGAPSKLGLGYFRCAIHHFEQHGETCQPR
jgi:hypothetical protein